MHWTIKAFLAVLLCAVVLWNVWSRVLAAIVSVLSTRRGVKVKLESLTMRTATNVLLTFNASGFVDEIRCRRIQIGWVSSVAQGGGRDDDEEEESPVSILHRLLMLLSMFRLHIRAVGVQVRIRRSESLSMVDNGGDRAKNSSGNGISTVGILTKSILPLVTFELNDIEVYSVDKNSDNGLNYMFRGKKIALDLKRADQDLMLENVFLCPGKRFVKNDAICNECGLVEINRMNIASNNSLSDLFSSFGKYRGRIIGRKSAKLKKLSLDVNSIRLNLDAKYLARIKLLTSMLKSNSSGRKGKRNVFAYIHKVVDASFMPPISVNLSLRSVTMHLPLSKIENQVDLKGLCFDLQTHPCDIGLDEHGRIELSVAWDKIAAASGESVDCPTWECQSSRSESQATLGVSCMAAESSTIDISSTIVDLALDIHLYALHTKLHHERIGNYLLALNSSQLSSGSSSHKAQNEVVPFNAKINLSLGNGSSLQFVNGQNVCMLHHSIDSASVTMMHSKDVRSVSGIKFSFCGIAMADSTAVVQSGMHELCQVLSNDSFTGCLDLDQYGDTSVSVSVSNLAGKISDILMKHICSVVTGILENAKTMPSIPISGQMAVDKRMGNRSVSFRADLLNIDLAILSTYIVAKKDSSINKDQTIDSALAARISNLSVSRDSSGLHRANGDRIMILYYEGKAIKDFNIEFDCMDEFIHAKLLTVDSLAVKEFLVDNIRERKVSIGPVEVYCHIDALFSMVHFSKSMEDLSGFSHRSKSLHMPAQHIITRTRLELADTNLCLPVSSDREVSLKLTGCEFGHFENEQEEVHFTIELAETSISIKGTDTVNVRNLSSEFCFRQEKKDCLVQKISCNLNEIKFILPYNRDPGPTLKVLSMYIKASSSMIARIRGSRSSVKVANDSIDSNGSKIVEKRMDINVGKGSFVFEHHPMEAWFARTTIQRSHATLLQHLWDEAHNSVMAETRGLDDESPLHEGIHPNIPSTKISKTKSEEDDQVIAEDKMVHISRDKTWKHLMSRHAKFFIKSQDGSQSLYDDLFRVDFADLKLLVDSNCDQLVVEQAKKKTIDFITSVDECSKDVDFRQASLFDIDMSASEVQVMIGGSNQPLYEGKGISIIGNVAFGKQMSMDPDTCERVMHIGMHHVNTISIPTKGTCPPMKVFTDIRLHAESSQVFFSPGFEPSLGLMGITSKRLVPSDPTYASKKPPPVPWWDDIRYFWRGNAYIQTDSLQVTVLPGLSPVLSAMKERLEVDANNVNVKIRPSELIMNTESLKAMAFRKTREENGGQLCGFPVADVKQMGLVIHVDWKLPNDRNPHDHYIFDSLTNGGKQCPVFVADVYKATSLDVSFDIALARNESNSGLPRLFIGGEIVSFWKKFVQDLKVPDYIKTQVRKGTYFVKKPKGLKKKSLPQLLDNLLLNVDCTELQMVHFTLDHDDPGGGLVVGTNDGELRMAWKCNQDPYSFLPLPPHAKRSGQPQRKTYMRNLQVLLNKVVVNSMKLSMEIDESSLNTVFRQNTSSSGDLIMSLASGSSAENSFHPGEPHWVADAVSISRSMEENENDPFSLLDTKPLKVVVDKCSLLTDLEMRDAVWATIEHLIAAFTKREGRHSVVSRLQSSKMVGESSEMINLQRAYSHTSDISASAENNELLSLLLQQKDAAGASPLVSPQATLDLERQESAAAEPDILPMTTSVDDAHSELKYEVEVRNLQLMLQRDHETGTSTGRLLLASKAATLRGMVSDHQLCMYNITTLDMEDVQAYISLSSVDPNSKVIWLGISRKNEFVAPSVDDTDSAWRRIFNPINIHLRHSKYQAPKLAGSRRFTIPSPVLGNSMQRQGEELILKVPEIAAVMDGREFEVLIDVVSFLITLGPTVHTCNSVANLLNHSDDQNVTYQQNLLQTSYRQLGSIRNEIYGVLESFPESLQKFTWSKSGPLPYSGGLNVPNDFLQNLEYEHSDHPSDSLRNCIQQRSEEAGEVSRISENDLQPMILLQWSREQEELALTHYKTTKSRLCDTTEKLKRQSQFKTSSRVLIHLNRVVWQLCNQDREPFVQASIKKVLFDRRRNRDRSGSARFIIQTLDILDATGMLPDGPATSAGVILTSWNPESSYEREPVLRIISTLGVPTSRYDVFEHLDATLHPLSLHLTEQIATACWEYFFPKEDQKSRQETFSSSVPPRKVPPGIQSVSPKQKLGSASKIMGGLENVVETGSPLFKQDSDVSSKSDLFGHYNSPSVKRRDSPIVKRKKSSIRLLKRFKYVKLNRAHMRITYQGYPLGIKDRVLVINSYTCENLDGTWRDLLSNVKQKAIFSALFSGLGLQGRKVKELMIGAAPSLSSIELPKSQSDDLSNNRGLLAKFGLKHNKGKKGDNEGNGKDDIEMQKKRALFGESMIHRAKGLIHEHLHRSMPVPNSPKEEESTTEVQRKVAVPLLELTEPLPPEDSSDSDASLECDDHTIKFPLDDGPGPLKAGLEVKHTKQVKVDKKGAILYSGYDPNKPPELGAKPSHEPMSGPRWMK